MKKDKTIQLTYHPTLLNRKPDTKIEKWIIYDNMIQTGITIEDICKYIGNGYGYTFTPNLYSDNKPSIKSFQGTSGFFLDFDLNSNPQEILNRFYELNIRPNLWYTSYSDTPEYRKFRVCLFIDEVLTDLQIIGTIFSNLFYHFPADNACKDPARIFFGGKEATFLTDEPIKLSHLIKESIWDIPRVPLQFDSEKPVHLLYVNNKSTGKSKKTHHPTYSLDQTIDFTYLEKLRNNNCDYSIIESKVRVFKEFVNLEKRFDYLVLFGLATNLHWLQGGMKLMKRCMDEYNKLNEGKPRSDLYYDRHFEVISQVKKHKLFPAYLYNFSNYPEDANHKNLISCLINPRGVIYVGEKIEKIKLKEAEILFKNAFDEALKSKEQITIIKAGVGIGKSTILKNLKKVAIALPTHKLKYELYDNMEIECKMVPELPLFENDALNKRIDVYHQCGLKSAVMELIGILSEDVSQDGKIAKKYIEELEESKNWEGTLLTTHERGINQHLHNKTIIFDEDPINSLISLKTFDLKHFDQLLYNYPDLKIYFESWFRILMDCEKNQMYSFRAHDLPIKFLTEKIKYEPSMSNILDFFNCSMYYKEEYKDKKGKNRITIHYAKFNRFSPAKKIIILSATINTEFYKKAFGKDITVIEIPEIENMGEVIQHTKYSFSRQSLEKRDKLELVAKIGNQPIITFKTEEDGLNQIYLENNQNHRIYFGNTRGYNQLKGKDIAVVGTPHLNPIVYYFHAQFIGINTNNFNKKMDYLTVQRKGMQFKFQTFDSKELQGIQLDLIEAELIQAIGRARTIRTNSIVQVFSNLPLVITDTFNFG